MMWFDPNAARQPLALRAATAVLLGSGAYGLATMLRWPGFLWFAFPLLVPALALRRPLRYVRLRALLLTAGAVIAHQVFQAAFPNVQFQAQMLGRLDVVCPILLAIGAVAAVHAATAMNRLLIVGASYGLMVLAGLAGMASQSDYAVFAAVTAVYVAALAVFLHARAPDAPAVARVRGARLAGLRALVIAASLALTAAALPALRTGAFALYGRLVFASMQYLRPGDVSTSRFLDLRRTVPRDFPQRSAVLLRVAADQPPGYLRGSCLDTYAKGRWTGPEDAALLPPQPVPGQTGLRRFTPPGARASAAGAARTLDVYAAPGFQSHVVHAPAGTVSVSAALDALRADAHGSLFVPPRMAGGASHYVLAAAADGPDAAGLDGSGAPTRACLDVPKPLRGPLAPVAQRAFAGAPSSTPEKLAALSRFFADGFRYELGVPMAGRDDPVIRFLTVERRGHCSLFAAATALLLRTQGVPTRVISGFVCAERHPGGAYWVARENTAHAWVEAYCAEERRWVLVDNTPDDGRPQTDSQFGAFGSAMDRWRFWRQRLMGALKSMRPSDWVAVIAAWLGARVAQSPRAWLGALVAFAAAFAGAMVLRRYRRRPPPEPAAAARVRACRTELETVLRAFGIVRRANQTLDAALASSEGNLEPGLLQPLRSLVRRYQQLRYGGADSTPESVSDLRRQIAAVVKPRAGTRVR